MQLSERRPKLFASVLLDVLKTQAFGAISRVESFPNKIAPCIDRNCGTHQAVEPVVLAAAPVAASNHQRSDRGPRS